MSSNLGEIVREIALDRNRRSFGTPCEVLSYDEQSQTIECSPIDGTADYTAKLQTGVSSGLLFVPKVGSIVIVEQTSVNSGYVTMWGEIDHIVFMNGENKGLVKVSELVSALNTIQQDINTLKTAFSSWVTVPNDGGAALKAIAATWSGQQLTQSTINDLENPKITH